MGVSLYPTGDGGGTATLNPKAAKNYFEFFATGSHREVLMLGDMVEQAVHYVRSKGHKVLCGARSGVCELCDRAGTSDDVSTRQVEYYVASFVRLWKERTFHQRIAVFSESGGEKVLQLLPAGSCRGHRLDVERYAQGTSGRFRIKLMEGLPRGISDVLPAAFDLLPFVRARFGLRQDPLRPLVFLPSFRSDLEASRAISRPKPLELSAEECRPSEEVLGKFREKLRAYRGESSPPAPAAEPPATLPIDPQPVPVPVVPSVPPPAPQPVEDVPEVLAAIVRQAPAKPSDEPADFGRLTELAILDGQLPYGPRHIVQGPPTAAEEAEALAHGTGKLVCDEVRRTAGVYGRKPGTNGHGLKGGAK